MNDPQPLPQTIDTPDALEKTRPSAQPYPRSNGLFFRWMSVAIFGAFAGLAIGFVDWRLKPIQYKAVAAIQIHQPTQRTECDNALDDTSLVLNHGDRHSNESVYDQACILQSLAVIREAIEAGKLHANKSLPEMSAWDLEAWIGDKNRLTVRPAAKDGSTNIVEISFRCGDAELAALVVASIISGYERFMSAEAQSVNRERLASLGRFLDDCERRVRDITAEYLKLAKASQSVRIGNEYREPYSSLYSEANKKLDEIRMKSIKNQALIDSIELAMSEDHSDLDTFMRTLVRSDTSLAKLSMEASEYSAQSDDRSSAKMTLAARLEFMQKSLKDELDVWQNEEKLLQKAATEQMRKSKETADVALQLEIIGQERNDYHERLKTLRSEMDQANHDLYFANKLITRLGLPILGQPDESDLQEYLLKASLIGAGLSSCLFVIRTTRRTFIG